MAQLIKLSADRTRSPNNENVSSVVSGSIDRVEELNSEAQARWADKLHVDGSLTRAMVSFQANKTKAVYRWFKYKEAFSAGLVENLLSRYHIDKGTVLDPFAGSGTALFAASGLGLRQGVHGFAVGATVGVGAETWIETATAVAPESLLAVRV